MKAKKYPDVLYVSNVDPRHVDGIDKAQLVAVYNLVGMVEVVNETRVGPIKPIPKAKVKAKPKIKAKPPWKKGKN